jgi:hypothetical protein
VCSSDLILQQREEQIRDQLRTMVSSNQTINGIYPNRQQKQQSQRLAESSCLGMFRNHNSDIYRTKLKLKLLAKQKK